jgi:hypothetical protein
MKHSMHICMAAPLGLVLFDPAVLARFAEQHGLQDCGNLFEAFRQHEAVGDAAVASGAVVPLYPLEEDDYRFVMLGAAQVMQVMQETPAGCAAPASASTFSAAALAPSSAAVRAMAHGHEPQALWQFTHSGLPLTIASGVLVATDLVNLLHWDHAAYRHYRRQSAGPGHRWPQDDMDVPPGQYALAISGGRDGAGHKVYGARGATAGAARAAQRFVRL